MNSEYGVSDAWLPLMNARINLGASVKGSLGVALLNLSIWMRDRGGRSYIDGTCLRREEIWVLSVESLFDNEEAWSSLFLVKETAHSFLPILGLPLVALVLMHLGIAKGMIDSHGSRAGWTFFSLFGAGATRTTDFLFWRTTCMKPSSSSSASLRSFNLGGTKI